MLENPCPSVIHSGPLILSFSEMSIGLHSIVAEQYISRQGCVIFETLQ